MRKPELDGREGLDLRDLLLRPGRAAPNSSAHFAEMVRAPSFCAHFWSKSDRVLLACGRKRQLQA